MRQDAGSKKATRIAFFWGGSVGALRNVADEVAKFYAMIYGVTKKIYIFD